MSACAKWRRTHDSGRGATDEARAADVPRAEFRSYYGRPVLKPPVWDWQIPAYLFAGGLSAGRRCWRRAPTSPGARACGACAARRVGRALASTYFLVSDLGRPERFHHMLRVAKPTLADERRHVDPRGLQARRRAGRGRGADAARLGARGWAGWCGGWPGLPGCRRRRSAPGAGVATRRCCCRRPPCPRGTRRTRSCRSCSPARPRRAGGGLGMVLAPVEEAGPARAVGRGRGRRWRWWRRG